MVHCFEELREALYDSLTPEVVLMAFEVFIEQLAEVVNDAQDFLEEANVELSFQRAALESLSDSPFDDGFGDEYTDRLKDAIEDFIADRGG